ncbi:hypothetical protein [Roseomonas xinghualingensis]|uniref:hypothetical protein n=1 Tax=Roseomonas xinghualingensis TaxID=2986475 RepID=UPI0021F0E679|nr:hypothetical protein [Roseomonas sp. SXEYE001]MCV4210457.1 hypothetical protein [Roseomonas sp. SXEYE001]
MDSVISSRDMLREMVISDRQQIGLEHALERVARACVVSVRRARAIWHGEPKRLWADEEKRIAAAYEARMQQEMQELEARRALVRARLEALKGSHEGSMATARGVARENVDCAQ